MKSSRKFLLAPMAICLLPLLHGCGGNSTPDATDASNTASNSATDTASNTATDSSAVSVTSAEMSRDHDGKDVTTTFKTTDMPIYTQVKLSGPGNGVKVKAVWTVVDAGGHKNMKFIEKELVADGAKDTLTFSVNLAKGDDWDKGTFKTDIYIDGKLDKSLDWEVQ